jgi:hypothetical protein
MLLCFLVLLRSSRSMKKIYKYGFSFFYYKNVILFFTLFFFFTCIDKLKTNKVKMVCCIETKHADRLQKLHTLWSLWIVIVENCRMNPVMCSWVAIVMEIFETFNIAVTITVIYRNLKHSCALSDDMHFCCLRCFCVFKSITPKSNMNYIV